MAEPTLQDFTGQAEPTIEDFATSAEPLAPAIPNKAIKTRAAYAAFLSENPQDILPNYEMVVSESQKNQDFTRQKLLKASKEATQSGSVKAISNVLSNPAISMEQKQIAYEQYRAGDLSDEVDQVALKLSSIDSKGETKEGEELRLKDIFSYTRKNKEYIQGLINNQEIKIGEGSLNSYLLDFFETALVPFATNKVAATQISDMHKAMGSDPKRVEAFFLSGDAIMAAKNLFESVPDEQKIETAKVLYDLINRNNSVFIGQNKVNALNQINAVLGGDYSRFDQIVDNLVAALDIIGLGVPALSKRVKKAIKPGKTAREEYLEGEYIPREDAKKNEATRTPAEITSFRQIADKTSPISLGNTAEAVNPASSRNTFKAAMEGDGDEVAESLYGASKSDTAAKAFPQAGPEDGSVAARTPNITENLKVNQDIVDELDSYGGEWFSPAEKAAARAKVEIDISLSGLHVHDNMVSVINDGAKSVINARFGMKDGGFASAREAVDQVRFNLKDYGVLESDLQVLIKEGDEYVPISLKEAEQTKGEFIVEMKLDNPYSAKNMGELEQESVRFNLFDSVPWLRWNKQGTAAKSFMDAASMLGPRMTGAASVQSDKSVRLDKLLLKQFSLFSDHLRSLPSKRQDVIMDTLKEANHLGINHTDIELTARGFSPEDISAVKEWRKGNDTLYYLENQDLAKTLRNQGFQVFDNGQEKYFGKPIGKTYAVKEVYDPSGEALGRMNPSEIDDLYTSGGNLVELRRPVTLQRTTNDPHFVGPQAPVEVSHILVRNTPTEYLRAVRDTDEVLSYREGYFPVQYKAPIFVDEIIRDAAGKEIGKKTFGIAATTEEAKLLIARQQRLTGKGAEDFPPPRLDRMQGAIDTDSYWDLQAASGRLAQRHRGAPLSVPNNNIGKFDGKYVANPVESAIRASRSIANRAVNRDMLESMKARAIARHPEMFPFNEKTGKREWLSNSNHLVNPGRMEEKAIRDMRTIVEHINYLEHGYENGLDVSYKALMNVFANGFAELGMSKTERATRVASEFAPVDVSKGVVYNTLVGTHVPRQILIQAHQSVRTLGVSPVYVMSGGLSRDAQIVVGEILLSGVAGKQSKASLIMAGKILGAGKISHLPVDALKTVVENLAAQRVAKYTKEGKELVTFIKRSGILDAIDRSNFVRGSLQDLADSSNIVARGAGKVVHGARQAGFDVGETISLISHMLVARKYLLDNGVDVVSKEGMDQAHALARALSYEMNFAGDMPYNQNFASLVMQFFQAVHKAALFYTNRKIPLDIKLRSAVVDIMLFGIPGAVVLEKSLSSMLPEDPVAREAVLFGVESALINEAASKLTGKESNIDFTSLSPFGMEGIAEIFHALTTQNYGELIKKMPAAAIGGRVQEAFQRLSRYAGFIDKDLGLPPETAISVLDGVLSTFSLADHAKKAYYIVKLGEVRDAKSGRTLKDDAGYWEAAMQLAGFRTQEEVYSFYFREQVRMQEKDYKTDVEDDYKKYKQILMRERTMKNTDPEFVVKVLGVMRLKWEDDPKAMEIVMSNLGRDIITHKDSIIMDAVKYSKLPNTEDRRGMLLRLQQLQDKDYDKAVQLMEDLNNSLMEMKDKE